MCDVLCSTCRHFQPVRTPRTLWGLRKSAAHEDARCANPIFPRRKYVLSVRNYRSVPSGMPGGVLLEANLVRSLSGLCAGEGVYWEKKEPKSVLTRIGDLGKRIWRLFSRKATSF